MEPLLVVVLFIIPTVYYAWTDPSNRHLFRTSSLSQAGANQCSFIPWGETQQVAVTGRLRRKEQNLKRDTYM